MAASGFNQHVDDVLPNYHRQLFKLFQLFIVEMKRAALFMKWASTRIFIRLRLPRPIAIAMKANSCML